MKNSTKNKTNAQRKNVLLALVVCMLMVQQGICQLVNTKGNFGMAVSSMFNADGYGVQYLPAVLYQKNRNTYLFAAVVQKQKANISGVQFNYEYTVIAPGEADAKGLEFFVFANAIYQNNALLGKQALQTEYVTHPENSTNVSQIHFKSVETYTGFGLRIKLIKNVKWVNSIGCGGYASFNSPGNLYYANHNFGLLFKTGISVSFKK
ncbi:MAG TPA: hypothetical protein VKG26_05890 [Bacteroidia bacterium]|nr:hypothetical protein [Bacteroidia bacterium]